MAVEPFSFLHAGRLRLDAPLRGTGPLEPADRIVAEEAPFTALEQLVDACLDQDVEFLLLTGDAFEGESPSLHARRALCAALETLHELEIEVFWEIGRHDLERFSMGVRVPDNVTPLDPDDLEPVAVVRRGRVIASIVAVADDADPIGGAATEPGERTRFRIGIDGGRDGRDPQRTAGIDYLASARFGRRTTHRTDGALEHDPGPLQGIAIGESGISGATRVSVDAAGAAELTFVPTAPVRWERMLVGVDRGTTRDELVERMALAILEREPAAVEKLWIVQWRIIGAGPVFDELRNAETLDDVARQVDRTASPGRQVRLLHRFQLQDRKAAADDELLDQVLDHVRNHDADPRDALPAQLGRRDDDPILAPIRRCLERVDRRVVLDAAERLAPEFLASPGTGD